MTIWQQFRQRRQDRADHVRHARPVDRDPGVTLIEVAISIGLLGIVIVPILLAVSSSIKSSNVSETSAQVETLLVNAVDRVNRAPRSGAFACDLTGAVEAAVETVGWPTSAVEVDHHYLDISGNWVPGANGTACPGNPPDLTPGLTQRITITITDPDERVSRTLEVVRGDV